MQAAGYDVEVVITRDGAVVRPVCEQVDGYSGYRLDKPEKIYVV